MEIKIYKNPAKAIKLLLLCSIFVLPSCWLIFVKEDNNPAFWAALCFFSLGYLVGFFNLFDRRVQIIINSEGIWDRTLKQGIIKWKNIIKIYEWEFNNQKFIPIILSDDYVFKKKPSSITTYLNRKFNAQELNLNISQLKVDSQNLVALINKLKNEDEEKRDTVLELYQNKI